MKITICGSMSFYKEMREWKKKLEKLGHSVIVPMGTDEDPPIEGRPGVSLNELVEAKIEYDFIRKHFKNIEDADAIVILNYPKKNIDGYIGGNTFLEMGYAFGLGKKIYTLFPVPMMDYVSEMHAMQPIVLNGDLEKLV
jgi:nucleoside 2-deoxyribosyltransferase